MNAQRNGLLTITATAIVTSLLLAHTGVAAEPERDGHLGSTPVTSKIDVSGLDLSSPSGADRLYRQIVAIAKSICGSSSEYYKGVTRLKHKHEHVQPCIDAAVDAALQQVADASGVDLARLAVHCESSSCAKLTIN